MDRTRQETRTADGVRARRESGGPASTTRRSAIAALGNLLAEAIGVAKSRSDARLPLRVRVARAVRAGSWREGLALLDAEFAGLPDDLRARAAALRTYLLLTRGEAAEGVAASADLLASGAVATCAFRFVSGHATNPSGSIRRRSLLHGPFAVSVISGDRPIAGAALPKLLLSEARDVEGRRVPHLRSDATLLRAWLWFLSDRARSLRASAPGVSALSQVTAEFLALNVDLDAGALDRPGADPHGRCARFLDAARELDDPRSAAYAVFIRTGFPRWAGAAGAAPGHN